MERLKHVKDTLLCAVESQLEDLEKVDAKELGEVVDMVKDMEEAMYYCSVVKAMEEKKEEEKEFEHFMTKYAPYMQSQPNYRDMDREQGRMYYGDRNIERGSWPRGDREGKMNRDMDINRRGSEEERRYPMEIRDAREGKSPISRKNYIESKELHQGAPAQMRELEKYLQELSQDITEMITDATPEEKTVLQQKLSILASKIK